MSRSKNAVLTIDPVCLVTMNALPKASLQERTTFGAPQLRRLVLCDVDRIPLPDLALMGEQPLQTAAQHEPLVVPPPRADCQLYRPEIVRLVREVITPEAQPFVDVEMVMLLCAGMTGFLEERRNVPSSKPFTISRSCCRRWAGSSQTGWPPSAAFPYTRARLQ